MTTASAIAAQPAAPGSGSTVRGRVFVSETGVGVPGLLVCVLDLERVDYAVSPAHLAGGGVAPPLRSALLVPAPAPTAGSPGTPGTPGTVAAPHLWPRARLGSVLTGPDGTFAISVPPTAVALAGGARPNLQVVVEAPEGATRAGGCLHVSPAREHSATTEEYAIAITAQRLEQAGVVVPATAPTGAEDPDAVLARRRRLREAGEKIAEGGRAAAAERVERHRAALADVDRHVDALVAGLPELPEEVMRRIRLLPPGAGVAPAVHELMATTIRDVVNTGARSTVAAVPAELVDARLRTESGALVSSVPAETGDELLAGGRAARPSLTLTRRSPGELEAGRRAETAGGAPWDGGGPEPEPEPQPTGTGSVAPGEPYPPGQPAPGTPPDVAGYITTLLGSMSAPESPPTVTRPTGDDVGQAVAGLQLRNGPADTPAYYDFHHLQMAFDDVWQEVLDDRLPHLVRGAWSLVLEGGGRLPVAGTGAAESLQALAREAELVVRAREPHPPVTVLRALDISPEGWSVATDEQRAELTELAAQAGAEPRLGRVTAVSRRDGGRDDLAGQAARVAHYLDEVARPADTARAATAPATRSLRELPELVRQVEEAVRSPLRRYAVAGLERAVNYGLLVTYRQRWQPLAYQVGRLVSTVTLAPKETRRFVKRTAVKKNRTERELDNNLRGHREETADLSRAEAEIVARADKKTNFTLTAEGGYRAGVANVSGSTSLTRDVAGSSQETKRDFREAVLKSADEYRRERTLEITTAEASELEFQESGELTNPNDEIPVTYLLYELQRRSRVSETIHRVAPVVLVAQDMPGRGDIDRAWLVEHDWILRRAILDDSFRPALDYLASGAYRGEEYGVEQLRRNVEAQRALVESVRAELVAVQQQSKERYAALEQAVAEFAGVEKEQAGESIGEKVWEFFSGGDESSDAARVREDAARDAYDRVARLEKDLLTRMEREVVALQSMTEAYVKALVALLTRRAQVERLQTHVRDNLFYYMQAIWSHEPPDQRYFRLHQTLVPWPVGQRSYQVAAAGESIYPGTVPIRLTVRPRVDTPLEYRRLAEVADLDSPLGYKGNYLILPLLEPNVITDFMLTPYLDAVTGLHDPDEEGNWTVPEFLEYVRSLRERLSEAEFAELLPALREQYRRLLTSPRPLSDEVVVPTGSLYIEALPGTHAVLEDFKLWHRAIDVRKVQAEIRDAELENVRAAARLLAGERGDPDIDKKILIEHGDGVVVADT